MQIDEPLSVVYRLRKSLRNNILSYKEVVSFIDTNDYITYSTDIVECDCQPHQDFIDENHHVLTGDLRIITNS